MAERDSAHQRGGAETAPDAAVIWDSGENAEWNLGISGSALSVSDYRNMAESHQYYPSSRLVVGASNELHPLRTLTGELTA
jgi:hypothetical protein